MTTYVQHPSPSKRSKVVIPKPPSSPDITPRFIIFLLALSLFLFVGGSFVWISHQSNSVSLFDSFSTTSEACKSELNNSNTYQPQPLPPPPPPPPALSDGILTVDDNMPADVMTQFLWSLRDTGSTAHVIIFTTSNPPRNDLVAIGKEFGPVDWVYLDQGRFPRHGSDLLGWRFIAWKVWLEEKVKEFALVMNCDMDIVFQKDPFKNIDVKNGLAVFGEFKGLKLGECHTHRDWYNGCSIIPQGVLARHTPELRICAGSTMGTSSAMLHYFSQMTHHIALSHGTCNDQGLHNFLIYEKKFEVPVTIYTNEEGPVQTIGSNPYFKFDRFGRAVNSNGTVSVFVHQFKHLWALRDVYKLRWPYREREWDVACNRAYDCEGRTLILEGKKQYDQ